MQLSRFIYLSVCQQNYSKTTGLIFMKFSEKLDMGHGMNPLKKVKVQVTKRSTPTFFAQKLLDSLLKFGRMIGQDPRNN